MTVFAAKYGIDANRMVGILRGTAFNTGKTNGQPNPPAADEEIAALVVISHQYNLNPFLKEIYAFRNKSGGITPVVGFDGWIRLVQAQPAYDGEEFTMGYDNDLHTDEKPKGTFYECTMWRRDRSRPTKVREYLRENWRNTDPWNDMPNRMLRMRSYIQCARIAFGFGGIYDHDEGEKIASTIDITPHETGGKPATRPPRELSPQQVGRTLEHQEANTIDSPLLKQAETVNAETGEIQGDAFRWLADEKEVPPEEEAGSRG
jgi:phage recombination protein Bet